MPSSRREFRTQNRNCLHRDVGDAAPQRGSIWFAAKQEYHQRRGEGTPPYELSNGVGEQ